MSKYPAGHTVGAIYEGSSGNQYLEAMPDMLSPEQFTRVIASYPPIPHDLAEMSPEERRGLLPSLASIYVPMPYQYAIYDTLYRAIATTYRTADAVESNRAINACYCGRATNYATQADSGSILGVPGCGKTATVHRCLSTMPQVIEHVKYQGQPLFCKQILWLHVECPSDCSVKTLGFGITALINAGYGADKISKYQTLSVVKIQQAAREYYGTQIYEQYFASLSAAVLSRLINWKLSSPERYALLAVMVGMDAEALFGPRLDAADPLLEQLLRYKETGIVYGKNDLAAKMGMQPGQLDSLAQKYKVQPFWRQIRQERNRCIRLLLTDNEYDLIAQAAKENGNTQLAVFVRTIILDVLKNN